MILNLLIQLEILFVNLFTTAKISTKKYKMSTTILYLMLFTIITITIFAVLKTDDTPQWVALLIGFSFILPLTLLYKASFLKMSTIMFFCWTQTMIISNISKSIAELFDSNIIYLAFLIQTVALSLTFTFIQKFARNTYKTIIDGISKESFKSLLILASILLSFAIVISYFVTDNIVKLFLLSLLMITSYSVYTLLKSFVEKSKKIVTLNKVAYNDSLTHLENRFSLFTTAKKLITDEIPFHCVYMDLDNLKGINDTYGHQAGDHYLISFAEAVTKSISSKSIFYRIAGDEFVCICQDKTIDIDKMKSLITSSYKGEHPFNGVSIGYSTFPKDGNTLDDLLLLADGKMYSRKNNFKFRINRRSDT